VTTATDENGADPEVEVLDFAAETRRLIDDMSQRIVRQRRRIERLLVHRLGPADEMAMVLDDMIRARDKMQAQLESLSKKPADLLSSSVADQELIADRAKIRR
jgi:hypothetical protein